MVSILQSNKGFCLSVCVSLNSSRTAGLIWVNFFCHRVVLGLEIPDLGFDFPKIPEKQFWRKILKLFLQKSLNFHVKNLYIFSNILSSEVHNLSLYLKAIPWYNDQYSWRGAQAYAKWKQKLRQSFK